MKWDWDYMVGTKQLLDYIEFLYYLQEIGYNDYFTSDTSPTHWDIIGIFEVNVRLTNKLWALLENINKSEFKKLMSNEDYIATWKFIEENIFSLK